MTHRFIFVEYRDYYEEPVKAKEAELPFVSSQYDVQSRSPSYDKISDGKLRQEYRSKKELHVRMKIFARI